MKGTTGQGADAFMQAFFDKNTAVSGYDRCQTVQIEKALQTAIAQRKDEWTRSWKHALPFTVLFIFLYTALGLLLSTDLSGGYNSPGHKSIAYALEAIPVLIAFSGYFVAILYIFQCKSSANRIRNWDKAILILDAQTSAHLFSIHNLNSVGDTDYSWSRINITLALFIGLTWLVIYNYLTFTTSGVIGSVISLFISTMTYVILDIQLLKTSLSPAVPTEHAAKDDNIDEQ